jgi:hypothetical protein
LDFREELSMKLAYLKFLVILFLGLLLVQNSAWSMTIQVGAGGAELIKRGAQWRFFRGTTAPSTPADAWRRIDFSDSGWELGESGFGYGDGDDETELTDMEDHYLAVYIRKEFTLATVPASGQVVLEIDFDDGFIAYLNNDRAVKSAYMPAGTATFETKASSHEAGTPIRYVLGLAGDLLLEGRNVLAIEGHNTEYDSGDFSLIPALQVTADTIRNGETWIVQTQTLAVNGSTTAPAAVSVKVGGIAADFNPADRTWSGEVSLLPGLNTITAEALDAGANVVDSGSAQIVYVPPANHAAGELTEDTTWSGAVIVDGNVVVPDGRILTIEPGTVVLMNNGVAINVYGQLLANGTDAEPIQLTHYGDGTAWKQIMFTEAADSRLAHCIIEYADCEGDHKDYYDDDCDDGTPLPPRVYHEAIVALASHLDIEGCTFQHLLGGGTNTEGDALAIISDDRNYPGDATANIIGCRFLSIGQGIHTRFSYVLIENCFFTGKEGDNDDVDLYGESTPPPLVLNNLFLNPGHDDMINPTRCSAIMIGNVIGGCDDHGVVLRDKGNPVLINNIIFDCSSAGIAVQNQCDALLVNNTIFDCGRGIRFFDHTGRWGPPYCLFPGSGKATVINSIIWDCPTTFELADSPYTGDKGSHVTVIHCDVQGGQTRISRSANSTVTWPDGNIDRDPLFANTASYDLHLKSQAGRWDATAKRWVTDAVTSPCIDAGTSYLVDDPNYGYSGLIDWRGELWPHGAKINMGAYGGTAQASMSGDSEKGNVADVDYDGLVGLPDYARLAQWWRMERALLAEDIDRNGVVDFRDVLLMGQEWTWQEEP